MSGAGRGNGWRSFFWTLFKRSRNAVALVDYERRLVEGKGGFVKLVGRRRTDLIGHPVFDLIAGGPRASAREWQATVSRGEWMGEARLVRAGRGPRGGGGAPPP